MSKKPPVLVYRRSRPEERYEEEAKESEPIKQAKVVLNFGFRIVTAIILSLILLVWLVVGIVFWVPWVLRATFIFLISLLESTFQGTKPREAAEVLRDAVSFYKRGFVVAIEMVGMEELEEDDGARPEGGRLLREIFWAAVVWYFILLWVGTIQFSPVDLWDWLVSIRWGDLFGSLPRLPRPGGT